MVAPASWFGHGSFSLSHLYCFRGVYPSGAQSLLKRARKSLCTTVTIFSCTLSRRPHSATEANRLQEHWPRNSLPSSIFICFVISIRLRKRDRMCHHSGTHAYIHIYIMYICYIHKIHTCICIHTYTHINIHTYTFINTYTPYLHIHSYIHTYTQTHSYTHIYRHTYVYTYIHSYIHKY